MNILSFIFRAMLRGFRYRLGRDAARGLERLL